MDVARLRQLASEHASADFGRPESIHLCNLQAGQIRSALLAGLAVNRPEVFSYLDDPTLGPWIAYCALDAGALSAEDEFRCLAVIKAVAAGQGLESIGASHWLAQRGV